MMFGGIPKGFLETLITLMFVAPFFTTFLFYKFCFVKEPNFLKKGFSNLTVFLITGTAIVYFVKEDSDTVFIALLVFDILVLLYLMFFGVKKIIRYTMKKGNL